MWSPRHAASGALGALLALVCLLAAAPSVAAQATGSIRGRIVSEHAGEPLSAAVVEVIGSSGPIAVASGRSGGYEVVDVPAGRRVIRARHIGHAPLEIEVVIPPGGTVRLDLVLRVLPVALEPVRVDAGSTSAGIDTVAARGAELGMAGARALDGSPGIAELGLGEPLQGGKGQDPPDPTDVLYVRGATADLKLVFLDGAPVYAPFALGGVTDVFIPDVLQTATVFLGGAPARYDGGLSYVMDLRTRGVRSDRLHASGAMDLLSSRAAVEGPVVPGVGVLATGRIIHGAGALEPLPYGYQEGLLRLDAELAAGTYLHATGFVNDEEVRLDDDEGPGSTISWGNAAAALRLVTPFAGGELEVTGSAGSYEARLPRESAEPVFAHGRASRERLAADVSERRGALVVRYGASVDRIRHRYAALSQQGAGIVAEVTGATAGAYGDLSWSASPTVRVRGGLRADHFFSADRLVLAPRLSVTLLATDRASVTAAAGRYHQYLRAPDASLLFARPDSISRSLADLSVGGSSHLTVALDQELAEGMRLGVEGFFKTFDGIPAEPSGAANSSGVDLWLSRELGRWTGWAGYSLAWVWSVTGEAASNRFAGRHLLSGGVGAPIARAARVDASFAYGSGLSYAPIALSGNQASTLGQSDVRGDQFETVSGNGAPLVPSPDRPYFRMDVSATHTASLRWGARDVRINSYLKLLNTLGRRDALFYRYDRERGDDLTALAVLPIVPVIGVAWRF